MVSCHSFAIDHPGHAGSAKKVDSAASNSSVPILHSQATKTLQADSRRVSKFSTSRATLRSSFLVQNSTFDVGRVEREQPPCWCQKQP